MRLTASAAAVGVLISSLAMAQQTPQPGRPLVSKGVDSAGIAPGMSVAVTPDVDAISSQIVGLDVFNNANEDVGSIRDMVFAGDRIKAFIVAVGGVLGVGDRYIAVDPARLSVAFDSNAKKWHANMDATVEQLKSAPTFAYPSKP